MCKHCVGAQLAFSGAHISCISPSINTTNRHAYQDQYVENGFHLSQNMVRQCHILSEGTFWFTHPVYIQETCRPDSSAIKKLSGQEITLLASRKSYLVIIAPPINMNI